MKYKFNHYIPASILRSWVTKPGQYNGVYVYDIKEQRKYFSSAEKPRPFSFAAFNDLYIPKIGNTRALSLEKWFSSLESDLNYFINEIIINRGEKIESNKMYGTILSIISFRYRSKYSIDFLMKAIESNPELKEKINTSPKRDIHHIILENIIHIITEESYKLIPCEISVNYSNNLPFIYCDSPYIKDSQLEYDILVIGKDKLIALKKSSTNEFSIKYNNCTKSFLESINKTMTMNARNWLIVDSEKLLDKYIPLINSEEYKENREKDKLSLIPIKYLKSGYSIVD